MGEVYRARDTRLKREAALKVLPATLTTQPERLARFQREAEVLASLNHPNIAQVYGLEEAPNEGGQPIRAIAMELVEGETLAERIARGPAPLAEALAIARQIADALEAAHDRGIVHRDLKPANVKVRPDGTVKVLDFGLAKAVDDAGGVAPAGVSQMATLAAVTSPALVTSAGMILGTAAYMSPEQARGQAVDKRADIWALGVVLYELVTGRRLFDGQTVSDTLAAVLREEPAWDGIPAPCRRLLRSCLRKDPRERLRDIGDARVLLEEPSPGESAGPHPAAAAVPRWRSALTVGAVATLAALLAAGAVWYRLRPAASTPLHLSLAHPGFETVGGNDFDDNIAIAPDGRAMAYVASATTVNRNSLRLYVRAFDRRDVVLLSTSARAPFLSPDGQWVGFVENNQRLSKVPVAGGPAVPIGGRVNAPRGISWGDDDNIVYATADLATGLMRVPANGGDAVVLTKPDATKSEADHVFPDVLPGHRAVLFTITGTRGNESSQIAVLDLASGGHRVLLPGGHPRFVAPGYVVFVRGDSLWAVRFDPDRLEVIGTPVTVLDAVQTRATGAASFAIAANGTLAYVERGAADAERQLVWLGRSGTEEPFGTDPGYYDSFALSRDGSSLAVTRRNTSGDNSDIWVWSRERRTFSRITFEPGTHESPLWTPDGRSIVYTTCRTGCSLYIRPSDGTGSAEPVLDPAEASQRVQVFANGWTPDGRLLFEELRQSGDWDVNIVSLGAGQAPQGLLTSAVHREGAATVSPRQCVIA
jgi:serine/threonine-protein kinase